MAELINYACHCPYCCEAIEVLIDNSVDYQEYVEDCSVCCRPIEFKVAVDQDGDVQVSISHEDE